MEICYLVAQLSPGFVLFQCGHLFFILLIRLLVSIPPSLLLFLSPLSSLPQYLLVGISSLDHVSLFWKLYLFDQHHLLCKSYIVHVWDVVSSISSSICYSFVYFYFCFSHSSSHPYCCLTLLFTLSQYFPILVFLRLSFLPLNYYLFCKYSIVHMLTVISSVLLPYFSSYPSY